MAKGKKIHAAEIVITTTDGGSFKVTGKEAQKLAKEMGGLGNASQSTDRRIKGVTQQSSNATKNFSKQAQTMQGGIVAVYATIAAQVFAVSAAFQFLKSSFETRNLIEGQKQFGAVTGVAYQTITRNVQEATGNMLQFKEAASGVAIGVAAGLSAGALEKLGEAAKNASLALGRDVTDSFNRLIRGVTKAEPELLDELGIVLRLENATTKYGVAIGKTKDQLNAYERTQAVLNDVLDQAETKYKIIGEVMDPDAFALGQLTKEIDELMMKFQVFVAEGLMPIINFFKNNAMALVAAMGLFVIPVVKSLLPDLNKSVENSTKRFEEANVRMKESWVEAQDAMKAAKFATDDPVKARQTSAKGLRGLGVKSFKGGDNQLNARQIAAYKRHMRDKTGIYKKFNIQERAAFRRHLIQQEAALRQSTGKQVGIVSKGEYQKQAVNKATTALVLWGEKQKQRAMAFTAEWGMKLMTWMGWIGIFAMVVQGLISVVQWFMNLDEEEKRLREETKKTTEDLGTLNEELSRMSDVRYAHMNLMNLTMSVEQLGNALQSADLPKQIAAYHRELDKGNDENDEVIEAFAAMAKELATINPAFKEMADTMEKGDRITEAMEGTLTRVTGGMINAGMATKQFTQNQESLNKSLDKTIRKFKQVPYQDLEKNLTASITGIRDALGLVQKKKGLDGVESYGGVAEGDMTEMSPMLQQMFGDDASRIRISKEFGMFAETEIRKQERRQKRGDIDKKLGRRTWGSGSAKTNKFAVDFWDRDDDGNITGVKTQAQLEAEATKESGKTQTMGRMNLNALKKAQEIWEAQGENYAELIKQGKEDDENLKMYVSKLREQLNLEDNINSLQEAGFKLAENKSQNLFDLAQAKLEVDEKGAVRTKFAMDLATNAANQDKADLKVQEKKLDVDAARMAVQAAEEKIRTKWLNDLKEGSEEHTKILNMDQKLLSQAVAKEQEQAEIKDQELQNANSAVELGEQAVKTQEVLTGLEKRKLDVQAQTLVNSHELAESARDMAMWARTYKNELAIANRLLKVGGNSPLAKAANRATRLGQLKGSGDDIGMIARAQEQAGDYAGYASGIRSTSIDAEGEVVRGALLGGGTGAQAGESMEIGGKKYTKYLQPITKAQEQYNAYLDQAFKLEQEGVKLGEQKLDLENQIAGVYIQGQHNAKLQMMNIDRNTIANLNPASVHYYETIAKHEKEGGDRKTLDLKKLKEESIAMASLSAETELLGGIQSTLSNGFQSMFQSMIDGTKSFKDSMKDLAKSVLADLAAMFMKAAAVKMMLAMFPGMGDGSGGFKSLFGGSGDRYGGIRSGPGYSGGGVARGPNSGYMAKLHGTEAIVPLGNDRSIPVDIRGGGGNTVNVSINMQGGQSQTSASGGGDMAQLGKSIGGLVQQHLQTEMRPGGLLNRQGTGGRGG